MEQPKKPATEQSVDERIRDLLQYLGQVVFNLELTEEKAAQLRSEYQKTMDELRRLRTTPEE